MPKHDLVEVMYKMDAHKVGSNNGSQSKKKVTNWTHHGTTLVQLKINSIWFHSHLVVFVIVFVGKTEQRYWTKHFFPKFPLLFGFFTQFSAIDMLFLKRALNLWFVRERKRKHNSCAYVCGSLKMSAIFEWVRNDHEKFLRFSHDEESAWNIFRGKLLTPLDHKL